MPRPTPDPGEPSSSRLASCPLCGSHALESVYRSHVETATGRQAIELELCDVCGLMFRNPRPNAYEQSEHYRSSAEASGNVWHENGAGTCRGDFAVLRCRFLGGILDEFEAPGRLLDVGCGWGDLLSAIEAPGWRLSGIEPCEAAVVQARSRGLSVEQGRVEDDVLEAAGFDVVTAISCLEHFDEPKAALASIARLLRPGGWLYLEVPDSLRPTPQVAEFFSAEHLTHFTPGSVQRMLHAAGFEARIVDTSGVATMRIGARLVGCSASRELPVPDDRGALRDAVRRYAEERARFAGELRTRLAPTLDELRARGGRLAIYGAGEHTRALLSALDLADLVTVVVDSDPNKRGRPFLQWRVSAPEELDALDVSAVLISSQPFQEEMAARIDPITTRRGILVLRCYPAARAA